MVPCRDFRGENNFKPHSPSQILAALCIYKNLTGGMDLFGYAKAILNSIASNSYCRLLGGVGVGGKLVLPEQQRALSLANANLVIREC